jgi:hypothetical protein
MSPEAENALPIAEARLTELLTSLLRAEEVGE